MTHPSESPNLRLYMFRFPCSILALWLVDTENGLPTSRVHLTNFIISRQWAMNLGSWVFDLEDGRCSRSYEGPKDYFRPLVIVDQIIATDSVTISWTYNDTMRWMCWSVRFFQLSNCALPLSRSLIFSRKRDYNYHLCAKTSHRIRSLCWKRREGPWIIALSPLVNEMDQLPQYKCEESTSSWLARVNF